MTTIPGGELARKRPAEIVPNRPAVKVIDRRQATSMHLWRLAGWFALIIGAVLFAGLLLSLMQQHV